MKILACLLTLCVGLLANAQTKQEIDLSEFIEDLFQVQDADIDYEGLYESLLIYYTNPINVNQTDPEELAGLYILTPQQINSLFDHIEKNGTLLSLYELQSIEGFDNETIRNLTHFVSVDEKADSRPLGQRIREEENHYLLLRHSGSVEKQAGFRKTEENSYLGSPGTSYLRYRLHRHQDFSFGFTTEKDNGERYWDKGLDFFSGHAALENVGKIEKVIVGDYQLQFGQGLVFGAGFSAGKGAETTNSVKRSSTGIRSYAGALESGFFRGGASTLRLSKLKLTTFYSALRQDANLTSDSTYSDFDEFANSIQATGFHRTANERATKNQIPEHSYGGILEYQPGYRVKIGATLLQTTYSKPIQKKPNNYNQFEFQGDHNQVGSLYASASWQNLIFFGEAARSMSGGLGAVCGWIGSLSPMIDMSMVLRNYDRNFHSFYGNGLSEGSRLINEKGVYWGIKIHPSRKHEFAAYYDRFSFPWLRYQTESPSTGSEYLIRYTYSPARSAKLYVQMRQENKQVTETEEGSNLSQLMTGIKRNYLFNADYTLETWELKTRVQSSDYTLNGTTTHGFAIAQDISCQLGKLKLSSRLALFDTDDFKNAQYIFEREVLYALSIPALDGSGLRSYLLAQYQLMHKVTLWARVGRTSYEDQETIGSGLSEIQGNKKTDYRVMMRVKL